MSLPILKSSSAPTPEALIRYLHQTESNWTGHLSESEQLDFGMAWINPALPKVVDANRVLDAALPPGLLPADAVAQAEAHYSARKAICRQWVMNPSAPAERTAPLVEYLISQGHQPRAADIMYLDRLPSAPISGTNVPLMIIPTRASFKHAQQLFDESAEAWNEPQVAEAGMLHLDDSHYDALLALRDGQAVGHVGVLSVGEIGRIDQLYVAQAARRHSIGTTMMSRALEICARSLFKHILLSVMPDNAAAIGLCGKFGFKKIGQIIGYQRPG